MTARTSRFATVVMVVLVALGCARRVSVAECAEPRDCGADEVCAEGTCVPASTNASRCTTDADCDTRAGEVCSTVSLRCEQSGEPPPDDTDDRSTGTCTNTSECPVDQYCNTTTGICATLAPGTCRQPSQCTSPSAPVCSSSSSDVPGRCVECVTRDDCGGAECINQGECSDLTCPAHSTPIGGQCRCDAGYEQGLDGTCVPISTGGGGGGGGTPDDDSSGGGNDGTEPPMSVPCVPSTDWLQNLQSCFPLGPYNTCSAQGECFCDIDLLIELCRTYFNADIDPAICDCAPPSGTWTCDPAYFNGGPDDGCDCGCGDIDPDCNGGGCAEPGCDETACQFCYATSAAAASNDFETCG